MTRRLAGRLARGLCRRAGAIAFGTLVLVVPGLSEAQGDGRLRAGVSAAQARFQRTDAEPLSGLVVGANASVAFRSLALEVTYAQGTLSREGASSEAEDLVDAEAMLGMRILPWLHASAGPHLRALVTPVGTERWIRLDARLRAEFELVPGVMRADGTIGAAILADVNTVDAGASARGAAVGVTMRVANSPVDLRLAYAVDRGALSSANVEAYQSVGLHAMVSWR